MGYIRHHCIIVTSWSKHDMNIARNKALEIFPKKIISDFIFSEMNTYSTFIIAPDGSKEGWETSDNGDRNRDLFINWLDLQRHSDGSGPYAWAELQYGDDNNINIILRHEALR